MDELPEQPHPLLSDCHHLPHVLLSWGLDRTGVDSPTGLQWMGSEDPRVPLGVRVCVIHTQTQVWF